MSSPYTIDYLSIGDELLLGIRANGHLTYLGSQMTGLGLIIRKNVVIRDQEEEILRFFRESWQDADIVIVTGGLGPTSDDVTRESIASALGRELIHHPASEEAILQRFHKLGRTPTDNNLKQAYLIDGAQALPNANGTAPGQWLKIGHKILVMLPGPASEMHPMWEEQVVPRLRAAGVIDPNLNYLQLRTCGLGESQLETILRRVFDRYPGRLQVGYCFHDGVVDVRLNSVGHSLSQAELRLIGDECREILGEDFVTFGKCSLSALLQQKLRALGKTLAVAESCTGGQLASAFTDIPGASKVFLGGLVCYTNDVKVQLLEVPESILIQHGAVSAECAVAMATGAAEKFGADYALSITGWAGPDGGTVDEPIGTLYFGLAAPVGVWAHRVVYTGNRLSIKGRAVTGALDWMRRKLNRYAFHELLDTIECHS